MEIFFLYYHHAMYAFQSEFKLFSCLNFKEFFACGRRDIWRLSDSIGIRAYIDLVHKRALNNLAKDVGSNPIAVTGNFVVKTKPGSFNAVSANMKLEQTIQREKKRGKEVLLVRREKLHMLWNGNCHTTKLWQLIMYTMKRLVIELVFLKLHHKLYVTVS